MKKILVSLLLTAVLTTPTPAFAWTEDSGSGDNGSGAFLGGVAVGILMGALLSHANDLLPIRYAPPVHPRCYDVYRPGYYRQVRMRSEGGFTAFRLEWVPGYSQRVCDDPD